MQSMTLAEAINSALHEEMDRDERVIVMGEDMAGGLGVPGYERKDAWGGVRGVTKNLVSAFGRERVVDTPISESAFIGTGVGAALAGYLRPVVELQFIDHMGVCLDQIFNQAAKLYSIGGGQRSVPLVVRTMVGGGARRAAHNGAAHYSVFVHFPGLKVVLPSTPQDAKGLLKAAIRDDNPVIFCEPCFLYDRRGEVSTSEDLIIPLGSADVKREGGDVTVVAIGACVPTALAAAERMSKTEGIELEVVDPRTLSPLDNDTIIASVVKTGRLVVVDEANPRCSMAADIIAMVAENCFSSLETAPAMVTPPHAPVPFAPTLEDDYLPSAEKVTAAIKSMIGVTV
jgi:pyruvate dehydrogenase E1 component beta subunit